MKPKVEVSDYFLLIHVFKLAISFIYYIICIKNTSCGQSIRFEDFLQWTIIFIHTADQQKIQNKKNKN